MEGAEFTLFLKAGVTLFLKERACVPPYFSLSITSFSTWRPYSFPHFYPHDHCHLLFLSCCGRRVSIWEFSRCLAESTTHRSDWIHWTHLKPMKNFRSNLASQLNTTHNHGRKSGWDSNSLGYMWRWPCWDFTGNMAFNEDTSLPEVSWSLEEDQKMNSVQDSSPGFSLHFPAVWSHLFSCLAKHTAFHSFTYWTKSTFYWVRGRCQVLSQVLRR